VGDLTTSIQTAQGCSSATHGYYAGGNLNKDIHKYSHSTDGNATDVGEIAGDTSNYSRRATGSSSYSHGYYAAGSYFSNQIHKFSFASESTQTDVGDLLNRVTAVSSSSSYTHGYVHGGYGNLNGSAPHSYLDTIQKYSFATDANATDVGNSRHGSTGGGSSSSLDYGYQSSGGLGDYIDKYSHVTDGNSSNIAGVAQVRGECGGTHG
jgi:hypothetical protein